MKHDIKPQEIDNPYKLLATWIVGLILVNSSFLTAAKLIQEPIGIRIALVVAAIANVPLFLMCIFFLQTKFRHHMLKDEFYMEYIKDLSTDKIDRKVNEITNNGIQNIENIISNNNADMNNLKNELNKLFKKTISMTRDSVEKVHFSTEKGDVFMADIKESECPAMYGVRPVIIYDICQHDEDYVAAIPVSSSRNVIGLQLIIRTPMVNQEVVASISNIFKIKKKSLFKKIGTLEKEVVDKIDQIASLK